MIKLAYFRSPFWLGAGLTALGLLGLDGCADRGSPDEVTLGSLTTGSTTATLTLQSDWTSGYCANVTVSNGGTSPTTGWQVVINLNQSTTSQVWSASGTISGGTLTVGPLAWNTAIAPGASTTFGFCGSASGTNYRPALASVSGAGNGGGGAGSGGAVGSGGATGSGGHGSGGTIGSAGTGGQATGTGGRGTGGSASGGSMGSGGKPASGGATASGGITASGGVTGSGGMTGSGGRTGSGGTTSGGQCKLPWAANNGTGSFTYYSFGQGSYKDNLGYRTACGYIGAEPSGQSSDTIVNIANPAYFAAIPGVNNFNTVDHCGACAQITNGSKSIVVTIVDECPYDGSQNGPCGANPTGHLDLSYSAWAALGYTTGYPQNTSWKYVPCPISGGIVLRIHGDPSWGQVYIENELLPIVSVRTSTGAAGTHAQGGFWQLPGSLAVGQTLTLTDTSGRVVNAKIASTDQTANVSSGVQFPMCM